MRSIAFKISRLLKWLFVALVLLVVLLILPVAYTEIACRSENQQTSFQSKLELDEQRSEAATFLTYPEWHIVYAYDDYARILEDQKPPHAFSFTSSIAGFWRSLCKLNRTADQHGGGSSDTKLMVYTIGVSFTAELAAKALYEETLGRLFWAMKGSVALANDMASANFARSYADFLQQTPWYKYDFLTDVETLKTNRDGLRNRERSIALGLEFSAKTQYAKLIASAVKSTGIAKLTIRSRVTDIDVQKLAGISGITVIEKTDSGVTIETPRYRAFKDLLVELANQNANLIEIAGNDDIMLSLISRSSEVSSINLIKTLAVTNRQGYGDKRMLAQVKVKDLLKILRNLQTVEQQDKWSLEHVYDY